MKAKILGLLAVGLLAGPMAANATILYSLEAYGGTYTFTSPTFVTAPTCGNTYGGCNTLDLYPNSMLGALSAHDVALVTFPNSGFISFFAVGTFGQTGTFASVDGLTPTMTISRIADVPEPGSLVLLGLGLAGLGMSRRRKAN